MECHCGWLTISLYIVTSNIYPNADTLFTNATYADEQLQLYYTSHQGAYTICKNSCNVVAFNPLPNVTVNYTSIISLADSHSSSLSYPPDTDTSIFAGYEAQRKIILSLYNSTSTAVIETGFSSGSEIPLTLVKPLSRGTITITNRDPLDPPLIDWNALTNPADMEIMVAALKRHREFVATEAMQELGPIELTPGGNVTSDEDIRAALRKQVQPTYSHLTSTCSMMKREYGGVVGPDLLVYGTEALSVVDASIMPLIPATHTCATVYAVAEKVGRLSFHWLLRIVIRNAVRDLSLKPMLTKVHCRRQILSRLDMGYIKRMALAGGVEFVGVAGMFLYI